MKEKGRGKTAKDLDKPVKEGIKEFKNCKSKKIKSLSDLK
jgi:hypothetical protein